jgi:hypothetical protein
MSTHESSSDPALERGYPDATSLINFGKSPEALLCDGSFDPDLLATDHEVPCGPMLLKKSARDSGRSFSTAVRPEGA